MKKKKSKNNIFIDIPVIIFTFIIINILLTSIFFLLKVPITAYNFYISLTLTTVFSFLYLYKNKYTIKKIVSIIIIFITTIISSLYLCGNIYDLSVDGNWYHKTAIGEMYLGWNPVYEDTKEFNEKSDYPINLEVNTDVWIEHYPKAYWYYGLNTYKATNKVESGTSLYILITIASIMIIYDFLRKKINKIYSIILSVLLTFNTVYICQILSFYNDALTGCLLFIMILLLINIIESKDKCTIYYYLYSIVLCIIINIKFSAFALAGIFSLCLFIYILFKKKNRVIPLIVSAVISLFISIFVIGASSYVKNYIDHKNPFYPVLGSEEFGIENIVEGQGPHELKEMNRIKKVIISLFSSSYNIIYKTEHDYSLKIPFTFNKEELKYFSSNDVRIGGFGVFFGGILLISIIVYIYSLLKHKTLIKPYYHVLVITSILCLLLIDGLWWARYFIIIYNFPFLIILFLIKCKNKYALYLSNILLLLIIVNVILVFSYNFDTKIKDAKYFKDSLEIIKVTDEDKKIHFVNYIYYGQSFNVYDLHKNIDFNKPTDIDNYNYHSFIRNGKLYIEK